MMLAPAFHNLSATRRYLPDGIAGVHSTLRAMRNAVQDGRVDMGVRQAAVSVIWLQPEREEFSEINALYEWVRDRVRYVRDINNVETISSAAVTLATMIGDCDDQTVLLAAMLESVGYPTRFVVAAYTIKDHFEHVYLQVFADGEWIDCDPTENEFLGWAPPDALSIMIEGA